MYSRLRVHSYLKPTATLLALVAGLSCAAPPAPGSAVALPPPVYVVQSSGERFCLPYFGQQCDRPGFTPLPERLYDPFKNWAWDMAYAGIVGRLLHYQVLARLATLDRRSWHGFRFHDPRFSSDYKWAEHVTMAHAVLLSFDSDRAAEDLLARPISQMGLSTGHGAGFEVRQRRLSWRQREALRALLASAELKLRLEPSMLRTSRTLEEAVMERPDHAAARRRHFTEFGLE